MTKWTFSREKATHANWRKFFDDKVTRASSDFEYDRGTSSNGVLIERLSTDELLKFIDPHPAETVLDAGCGTGGNIVLLSPRVKQIIGIDYCNGAIARCERRLAANGIENVRLICGEVTSLPVNDNSIDKVLCLSVLQYLSQREVEKLFTEFRRILKNRGTLILHVKNLSSLYLSTLWLAKTLKLFLGMKTKLEYLRSYSWYVNKLRAFDFEILKYNSFNWFGVDLMPKTMASVLEAFELRYYNRFPLRLGFVRRHGAELKIRARLGKTVGA